MAGMGVWSLRKKIIATAALPFCMVLVLSSISVSSNIEQLKKAKLVAEGMDTVVVISKVVHQLQRERGKSATFANGGIPFTEVKQQQDATDAAMKDLSSSQLKVAEGLTTMRGRLSRKEILAPQLIREYTDLIAQLLDEQAALALSGDSVGMGGPMRSISLLEMAKESAGRLRANLASVLASDQPLSPQQFEAIVRAKSGVDVNLASPALVVSETTRSKIRLFFEASEWRRVNEVFQVVAGNAGRGKFGQDPKLFFATITGSIDQLAALLADEVALVHERIEGYRSTSTRRVSIVLCFLVGITLVLALVVQRVIAVTLAPIHRVIADLGDSSTQVAEASHELDASSDQMASAATEAAASLQETVASVEEISSMVQKNAENAEGARRSSEVGEKKVLQGQEIIGEMTQAIAEIEKSNNEILREVTEGNRQISQVVKVIAEIGEKTKVINDIVFQTKLLSFNASVEAARAGESGKGFAVVAEEVGNLARMSGTAAEEISKMLEASLREVERIVQDSTRKVEDSFKANGDKLTAGVAIAGKCSAVLGEIVQMVSGINQMVVQISTASQEQSLGVGEISKAMSQMDQVTQQNAASASESAGAAKNLAIQSGRLRTIIASLNATISGSRQAHSEEASGIPAKAEFTTAG